MKPKAQTSDIALADPRGWGGGCWFWIINLALWFTSEAAAAADLHSKSLDAPPRSNCPHFHAVFGKLWPIIRSRHPFDVAPPLRNPGSAAEQRATLVNCETQVISLADLRGYARVEPPGVQTLSFSCGFRPKY